MARYALIDDDGVLKNIIEWDGVAEYEPPNGCTVRLSTPADEISLAPPGQSTVVVLG